MGNGHGQISIIVRPFEFDIRDNHHGDIARQDGTDEAIGEPGTREKQRRFNELMRTAATRTKKDALNAHVPYLSRKKLCYNRVLSSDAS
ncbi:hypothetical protein [Pandoraea anhela]|uniref:hypothetical protein n=1 Tax=Pandoraea anhela TaxID=2508295 RepID=UPI00123F49F1|nr:hypothetical protein [Pandoraea anhela]